MNIRKWKDSPALKETRDMLEIKLEDKKVRGILNWIFQIAVVLIFGILAGIALFQSVTVQERILYKQPCLQKSVLQPAVWAPWYSPVQSLIETAQFPPECQK